MKKIHILALLLSLLLLLCACAPTVTPQQPDTPPQTEPAPVQPDVPTEPIQPDTSDAPTEPDKPDTPDEPAAPEEPDTPPAEPEKDTVKPAYTAALAALDPADLEIIQLNGWGETYEVKEKFNKGSMVTLLQSIVLSEQTDPMEPGAISLKLHLTCTDGSTQSITLPAFSISSGDASPEQFYAIEYDGDLLSDLMAIADRERKEEPVATPFEASWYDWTEARENTVVLDEKGQNIRLVAQEDMKEVELYRVTLNTDTSLLDSRTLLHTFGDLTRGQLLDFLAASSGPLPELAVEWTDTFGFRTRWFLLPVKAFTDGQPSQEVQLFYDRYAGLDFTDPIRMVYHLNPEDVSVAAFTETDPYDYLSTEAAKRCDTGIVAEYDIDLDGNGRKNRVQLLLVRDPEDEDPKNGTFALRIVCGSAHYDLAQTFTRDVSLWLQADMDEDSNFEFYFSGDDNQGVITTYGWKLTETGPEPINFLGDLFSDRFDTPTHALFAEITDIIDGRMTVETTVDLLGKHTVTQIYSAERDGTLSPFPGERWVSRTPARLTVKQELPVTLGAMETTLSPGVVITITEFHQHTVYFKTDSGQTGYITLQPGSGDLRWVIGDTAATDYFEALPE